MQSMTLLHRLLAITLFAATGSLTCSAASFYFSAGAGRLWVEEDSLPRILSLYEIREDDDDASLGQLAVGVRLNPHWSVELGYARSGKINQHIRYLHGLGDAPTGGFMDVRQERTLDLVTLTPRFHFSVARNLIASVGPQLHSVHLRTVTETSSNLPALTYIPRTVHKDYDFTAGATAGLSYQFTPKWSAHLDFTALDLRSGAFTSGRVLSMKAQYAF